VTDSNVIMHTMWGRNRGDTTYLELSPAAQDG